MWKLLQQTINRFEFWIRYFRFDFWELVMRMGRLVVLALFGVVFVGCGGSSEIVLPTDNLTPEQIEQIKKDDAKVADEESQGAKKR